MTLSAVKPIRGLERALQVLRHLQRNNAMSLHELHLATGLSKATLSRILLTLQRDGFAAQRIADDRWNIGLSMQSHARSSKASDRLSQVASAILDELCARIIWPSDLSVRVGTHMELRETSRAHSSLMLGRLRIGFPINMVLSAPGRAYLANSTPEHREHILQRLRKRPGLGHAEVRSRTYMDRLIKETLSQGYAVRDPNWGGHISNPKSDYDDGLNAIAVPIKSDTAVLGCVNIVWIRKLLPQPEMVRRHLSDLTTAAAAIEVAYHRAR